jgi:hypothetical protein
MTVRKVSISLPPDIYQAVLKAYPNQPLSQAITELIKQALGLTVCETFGMTNGKTAIPPELAENIRYIVREELVAVEQQKNKTTHNPIPLEVTRTEQKPVINDSDSFGLVPEQWYTQAEIRQRLPDTINPNTNKSKISKAVASGKLVSNGGKGLESRIQGSSAIEWLTAIYQENNPEA